MDLRISVVLLFVFLTGGYSLRCFSCIPDWSGYCEATEQICPAGSSSCKKIDHIEHSFANLFGANPVKSVSKHCAYWCTPGTEHYFGGADDTHCCNTDLCNAADGVYKGSFLLLFSPLLSYFLFQ